MRHRPIRMHHRLLALGIAGALAVSGVAAGGFSADQALLQAKAAGRDRIVLAQEQGPAAPVTAGEPART